MSDIWLFVRSLFWREARRPECQGPIFEDAAAAHRAFGAIPAREFAESPYVYLCDEGHFHAQITRAPNPDGGELT